MKIKKISDDESPLALISKNNFLFQTRKRSNNKEYHPSNPNPMNHDNTTNSFVDEQQYASMRLPPVLVYGKASLIITKKYNRKQKIDPYLSAKELALDHKLNFREKQREFTPDIKGNSAFYDRGDKQKELYLDSIRDYNRINKAIIEYRHNIRALEEKNNKEYHYNYFPFINGEVIEHHQKKINEQRNIEMKSHLDTLKNTVNRSRSKDIEKDDINQSIYAKDKNLNSILIEKNLKIDRKFRDKSLNSLKKE